MRAKTDYADTMRKLQSDERDRDAVLSEVSNRLLEEGDGEGAAAIDFLTFEVRQLQRTQPAIGPRVDQPGIQESRGL